MLLLYKFKGEEMDKYSQYSMQVQNVKNDELRVSSLKTNLNKLQEANDIESARDVIKTMCDLKHGNNTFYVGNVQCRVNNNKDSLVITMDSPKEFICYSFE